MVMILIYLICMGSTSWVSTLEIAGSASWVLKRVMGNNEFVPDFLL